MVPAAGARDVLPRGDAVVGKESSYKRQSPMESALEQQADDGNHAQQQYYFRQNFGLSLAFFRKICFDSSPAILRTTRRIGDRRRFVLDDGRCRIQQRSALMKGAKTTVVMIVRL